MDIFLNILYYSFTAIYAYIAIIIIITILMENRNPVKSFGLDNDNAVIAHCRHNLLYFFRAELQKEKDNTKQAEILAIDLRLHI